MDYTLNIELNNVRDGSPRLLSAAVRGDGNKNLL